MPEFMAAEPDQTPPHDRLHNFPLPSIRWGNQKLLRPSNVHPSMYSSDSDHPVHAVGTRPSSSLPSSSRSNGQKSASQSPPPPPPPPVRNFRRLLPLANKADDRAEDAKEKPLIHTQTLAEVEQGEIQEDLPEQIPRSPPTRVAASGDSNKISTHEEDQRFGNSPAPLAETRQSLRLRGLPPQQAQEKTIAFPKFSVSLTPEEIEADFLAMTGSKPPRRPKRRAKNVEKMCDELSPGIRLSNVTADSYNVSNLPEPR